MQEADKAAKRILRGIEKDRFRIYPSRLFRVAYHLNKIILLIKPAFQYLENRKYKKWLSL